MRNVTKTHLRSMTGKSQNTGETKQKSEQMEKYTTFMV